MRKLDSDLLALEKDPNDPQKIDQIFRVMHTLKGSSGMFGYDKITEITHELENVYDRVRSGQLEMSSQLTDLTFATGDHIGNLLADFEFVNPDNISNHNKLAQSISYFVNSLSAGSKHADKLPSLPKHGTVSTFHILFYPDESIIKRCINLSITFHDLFLLGRYQINPPTGVNESMFWSIFLISDKTVEDIEDALLFVMDYCKISKVADFDIFDESLLDTRDLEISEAERLFAEKENEQGDAGLRQEGAVVAPLTQQVVSQGNSQGSRRIHVEAAKLDNLMYLVSELVTARSELLLSIEEGYSLKTIGAAERIDKLSKLFSDTALNIRLVSMEEMIGRFQRLTRDLARSLGKKVEFVTEGADTELDKNIIDAIAEPIMHLVRNCIDHGIETPDVRRARGKDETGRLFLSACKRGNYVFVQISDDGNGIDPDGVYRKAVEKGLVPEGAQLSTKEICDLIFMPGFSTAKNVSEVSGRGVGMDIVWRKIREIRGEITIDSTPKVGTTFHIKLQQTISIIDTLLVSARNTKYAIPIEDVEICGLEAHENIINRQSNLLEYNNELMPYVSLRQHLLDLHDAPEREKIIVINKQDSRYAIVADQIIGEFQAVVKPLGQTFVDQEFLSGASIYGDGSIVLLLDTEKLKNQVFTVN